MPSFPARRASLAVTAVVCALAPMATAGCAAPTSDATAVHLPQKPELELPLALDVDQVVVRRGEVRFSASAEDGSADVAVGTGQPCAAREIGHGLATRTGFVWSLSQDDLARALDCNLTVTMRVDTPTAIVKKTATLPVSLMLIGDSDDEVKLVSQEVDGPSTRMAFRTTSRARLLRVGGMMIGAEPDDSPPGGPFTTEFVVPNEDLTRAIASRRPLTLKGASFATVVTIGRASLDLSDDLPPEPPEPPAEVPPVIVLSEITTRGQSTSLPSLPSLPSWSGPVTR